MHNKGHSQCSSVVHNPKGSKNGGSGAGIWIAGGWTSAADQKAISLTANLKNCQRINAQTLLGETSTFGEGL